MTSLEKYKEKRNFSSSPEPEGKVKKNKKKFLHFVVQKHDATRLHFDFRLEINGVYKSWAIPKGPSMKAGDKHLAMLVEDHPIEYGSFEGVIPKGNYGAGTVMIWDNGVYASAVDGDGDQNELLQKGFDKGDLKFVLNGEKLKGEFALIRMATSSKGNEWLIIKKRDEFAVDETKELDDISVISGRTMEEIKNESNENKEYWYSNASVSSDKLPGEARKKAKPSIIIPMMAKLASEPDDSDEWLYEIKWDGYRTIADIHFGDVNLTSRNRKSFNKKFTPIKENLSQLGINAIIDGEICVLDKNGNSEFSLIQNYERTHKGALVYYAFDILYYDGYELMNIPLYKRKELLKQIIPKDHPVILYSDHVRGHGKEFFELAKEMNMEGVIGKQRLGTYHPGKRVSQWLKFKHILKQEVVIAGYTSPKGGRKKFGSLVMGAYSNGKLEYIGNVGTGFDDTALVSLHNELSKLVIKESPFDRNVKIPHVTWVKPQLVAEVKYQEWTNDGSLRQPVFLGLREDKSAKEVVKEKITENKNNENNETTKRGAKAESKNKVTTGKNKDKQKETGRNAIKRTGTQTRRRKKEKQALKEERHQTSVLNDTIFSPALRRDKNSSGQPLIKYLDKDKNEAEFKWNSLHFKLTNLNKIYWPEEGYTKGDLINYYYRIANYILPYIKEKPQSLRRNPNGITKDSFFQKDMPEYLPDWIKTKKIYSESNEKNINYMVCSDVQTLVYMANMGCIEINSWFSKISNIGNPDYMVFDLDPLEVGFDKVIETALATKKLLDSLGIKSYCKTSGSRGIHICVPTGGKYGYDIILTFAEILANQIHALLPDITSIERLPSRRKGKVYIDFLQNRKGQTLAAPYCLRPVKGALVSTPLEWNEVKKGLNPQSFTIETIFQRLEEKGDLFREMLEESFDIEEVMKKL